MDNLLPFNMQSFTPINSKVKYWFADKMAKRKTRAHEYAYALAQ